MNENLNKNLTPDINKIIADLTAKLIADSASDLYKKGKSIFKGLSNDIKVKRQSSYESYLSYVYKKYSKAKSFLIRDESTQLYDFYVPMGISCGKKKSGEASIFNFTEKNPFAVIKGSAGSGKSMMMRHLFLNTIEKEERVPIFAELRRINEFNGTLIEFIRTVLNENKFTLDDDYIDRALELGHFAIFLDGFDEIALSKRKSLIKEIKKFSRDYDRNIVIISSRPEDEFSSWGQFDIWDIAPLNLAQALKLIQKVPSTNIDGETRDKFLKDLEKDLFKKHESFLSNPLLLSIMVITYASSGDVPQKLSTFYENAYIALFERHDALKGAFKRDRSCPLDILEFKKIFAAFSTLTASRLLHRDERRERQSLRFPKTDALNFIDDARNISDVSNAFKTEDFLEDCIKAVCLLLEDGLEIAFAHRSFQEYFTALFIANLDEIDAQKELINSFLLSQGSKIVDLLFEVNPLLVEKLLLVPNINALATMIGYKGKVTPTVYKKFLTNCFDIVDLSHPLDGERDYIPDFIPLIPPTKLGYTAAHTYIFALKHYSSLENFSNLSPKSLRMIGTLYKEMPGLTKLKNGTRRDVTKVKEFLTIFANDERWGVSISKLALVLNLKDQITAKHQQIVSTRREMLLNNLRGK